MRLQGALLLLAGPALTVAAAPITLIKDGQCYTAIYVAPEIMDETVLSPDAPPAERDREPFRIRVRESVKDLARYLGQMTSTTVPIYTRLPQAGEETVPILIGRFADPTFGPFTLKTRFQQGMRLVVSEKGVGLQGETGEGISYAIYELLDRLGCRWYIPGDLGEVIPSRGAVTLAERDLQQVPGTVSRRIWYADDAFQRRNRLGGFPYNAGHALEGYITREQLEQHPDWNAEIGGKRDLHRCDVGYRLCWANPEVSAAVADELISRLDQNYSPCISISPGDGVDFCECAQCRALDAGDWDPSMSCISITDRYIHFANRVAERVCRKHPDVILGFLAYVQFTRPPVREKLHPNLIPQLAPITYCRAHTLKDPNCPSRQQLRPIIEGWGKASQNIAMYEYLFHLAEVAAPFPMIQRNVDELPVQYAHHVTLWTPETMPNFETALPGMYLGIRMAWNPQANPQDILNEFYLKFYGAAAQPMRNYWRYIDDCWTTVPEHAGAGFGYMRRFTLERLAEARRKMDAALQACRTAMEFRRVQFADESLRQLERFMKIRRDYFAGRFKDLEADTQRWIAMHQALAERYQENYAFTKTGWAPQTISVRYFKLFYYNSYLDLSRIGQDFTIVSPSLLTWSYAVDKEKQGEAQGWQRADFNDQAWKKTDVARETWATLGLMGYYGSVWYRSQVNLPDLPMGKKVYLWVGATDGACKVFVNGQHVSYLNAEGEQVAEANGFCRPLSFEITEAVKPNADNQITLVGTRNHLNELGTGGLLGPVLIYREK